MNTPETDKLEYEQECNFEVAWEDHCRRLETERDEARKQRDDLMGALIDWQLAHAELSQHGKNSVHTALLNSAMRKTEQALVTMKQAIANVKGESGE